MESLDKRGGFGNRVESIPGFIESQAFKAAAAAQGVRSRSGQHGGMIWAGEKGVRHRLLHQGAIGIEVQKKRSEFFAHPKRDVGSPGNGLYVKVITR